MWRTPVLLVLALLSSSCTSVEAGRGDRLPFDLQLNVGFDESVGGRESVREEVERVILRELDGAACFRTVESRLPEGADRADLRLIVRILEVTEETSYDLSIAAQTAPNAPPAADKKQTTRMMADVELQLSTVPEATNVRSKRFQASASHRPESYEDARAVVRRLVLDDVVDTTVDWVCKGSESKLRKQIAKARARSSANAGGPP
jgi:hypothetical protein